MAKIAKQSLNTILEILNRDRMVVAARLASGELDTHPAIRAYAVEKLADLDRVIDELELHKLQK